MNAPERKADARYDVCTCEHYRHIHAVGGCTGFANEQLAPCGCRSFNLKLLDRGYERPPVRPQ